MAKKRTAKVIAPKEVQATRPVRLDLTGDDHDRLDRSSRRLGLSKSSYVRMALFERLEADKKRTR